MDYCVLKHEVKEVISDAWFNGVTRTDLAQHPQLRGYSLNEINYVLDQLFTRGEVVYVDEHFFLTRDLLVWANPTDTDYAHGPFGYVTCCKGWSQ